MKKQMFVVEGKNDVSRLEQVFPNIEVVSVNGSAVDNDIVEYLKSIKEDYEIILCMDPDYPGLKIRNELEEQIEDVSHIFIERNKAFSKNRKKIGLEHLTNEDIELLLNNIYKSNDSNTGEVTLSLLLDLNLVGSKESKALRKKVAEILKIGHVNGKMLLKRLNQINMSKENLIKVVNQIKNPL